MPEYNADFIEIGYKLQSDELWPKYRDYLIEINNKTIAKIKDLDNAQDKVLDLENKNERLRNYGKN